MATNFKTKTSTHYLAIYPRINWDTLFTSPIHCLHQQYVPGQDKECSLNNDESSYDEGVCYQHLTIGKWMTQAASDEEDDTENASDNEADKLEDEI